MGISYNRYVVVGHNPEQLHLLALEQFLSFPSSGTTAGKDICLAAQKDN